MPSYKGGVGALCFFGVHWTGRELKGQARSDEVRHSWASCRQTLSQMWRVCIQRDRVGGACDANTAALQWTHTFGEVGGLLAGHQVDLG